MPLLGRGSVCIVSPQKIWALQHWAIYVDCSVLLLSLFLLFHSCCCCCCLSVIVHNYRWTTTKLHSNNSSSSSNNNNNKKINLHKFLNLFFSDYTCCYYVLLLLLFLFISHCVSTITDEKQQQHRAIYINCSVFKSSYISHIRMYDLPLQELNSKWANKSLYLLFIFKSAAWMSAWPKE